MFEKYNEKARRALFFARYEASKLGSKVIEDGLKLLRQRRLGSQQMAVAGSGQFEAPGMQEQTVQARGAAS